MKYILEDNDGNRLDLSAIGETYYPTHDLSNIDLKNKLLERYGVPGGFETGVDVIGIREIKLKINIIGVTDLIFRQKMSLIYNFFDSQRKPFYLVDTDNNLRAEIVFDGMQPKFKGDGTVNRVGDLSLNLKMIKGYFEQYDFESVSATLSGSRNNFTITVADPNGILTAETYPFLIEINPSSSSTYLYLINTTSQTYSYFSYPTFTSSIKINCQTGEVKKDDVIDSSVLQGGNFIKLKDGANSFTYISDVQPLDITFDYRRNYIV